MDHLRWHYVSVSAKAKACADFGHLGYCCFPGLVLPTTVSELLESAKAAEYHQIFNQFKKNTCLLIRSINPRTIGSLFLKSFQQLLHQLLCRTSDGISQHDLQYP